jgi:hypothetical protein
MGDGSSMKDAAAHYTNLNARFTLEQLLVVAARYLSRPAELGRSDVELAIAVEKATEALAVAREAELAVTAPAYACSRGAGRRGSDDRRRGGVRLECAGPRRGSPDRRLSRRAVH